MAEHSHPPSCPEPSALVAQIHESGAQIVLAVTGGGSGVIGQLFRVAGASRTMLEARVPYAATAMDDWLRAVPENYSSARTARAMAMVAWQRAGVLARANGAGVGSAGRDDEGEDAALIGVAATASLASDRPKRGPHRVHAAAQTRGRTWQWSLELDKGRRSRGEEEDLVSCLLLNLVATACGVTEQLELHLTASETIERHEKQAPPEWQDLLTQRRDLVVVGSVVESPAVVFPGAYNPRHSGHRAMAQLAAELCGGPVVHEISIENVDKPPLDFLEIEARLAHFDTDETVCLTRADTFVAKAALFPGTTFVVGADTLRRIAEPKYYRSLQLTAEAAIDCLASAGCRFLVFGRLDDGQFCTLDDLALPPALASLCREVPESRFRDDISSTELRRQAGEE